VLTKVVSTFFRSCSPVSGIINAITFVVEYVYPPNKPLFTGKIEEYHAITNDGTSQAGKKLSLSIFL
jgi:hypothetical protein